MTDSPVKGKENLWPGVQKLAQELVDRVGSKQFIHEVVTPPQCMPSLAEQFKDRSFSSIVDVTGKHVSFLRGMFPNTPVEDRVNPRRVRTVNSTNFKTIGYQVEQDEIARARNVLDLENPLIFDDISFSGGTILHILNILGINPETAIHASFVSNEGHFGPGTLGATPLLERLGMKTVSAKTLYTPQDDGWHLEDLYQHPNLGEAFGLAIDIYQFGQRHGQDKAWKVLFSENVAQTIFPQRLTSEDLREMQSDGRFIPDNNGGILEDDIFVENPFLWISPYFQGHVDMNHLINNREHVLGILTELQQFGKDGEPKRDISYESSREQLLRQGAEKRFLPPERR